ncbi:hypothetical protein RKD19_005638 [Streptomyces canus]
MTSGLATTRQAVTSSAVTAPALTSVTRIGVTGHRRVPAPVLPGVRAEMRRHLGGGAPARMRFGCEVTLHEMSTGPVEPAETTAHTVLRMAAERGMIPAARRSG